MPNTRLIKRRIKSAQNIAKITKAMEMVSASKMRRAQAQAVASQPYAHKLQAVMHSISQFTSKDMHPLLQEPSTGQPLLVVFSTDRGLCGGLNNGLFKLITDFSQEHKQFTTLVVGRKAQDFVSRMGFHITASFTDMPEKATFQDIIPIADLIRNGFLEGQFREVHVLHMEFVNTLTQEPHTTHLLPLQQEDFELQDAPDTIQAQGPSKNEYSFEPNAQDILAWLLPYYVEVELYQLLLDAKASEHSARMIAMQNASNNANDVVGSLKLEYNKSRQAAITQELIEITTTKEYS